MQTEKNIWLKVLSLILTLALLISCVPNQVYAIASEALANLLEQEEAVLHPDTTTDLELSTARIVAEDASRRGEFYKEYIMNNGLRYATVYPSAIHYEDNGQWKDIDNTLVAAISGGKSVYQNTAGAWNVRFPRSLSGSDMIGITKDGHTVQFGMAGELRSSGDLVVASIGQIGSENAAATLAVSTAQTSIAQIQQIDLTEARASAEHPETILDKLNSRLTYANVYPNTNVVYDLQGNQLKESVVMQSYDASLWGYRYTLDTGDLVPVLREDQQIDLCDPETNEVVLTMPAPYMLDNNGEISYDVEVMLTRNGSSYLLSYYLPREWLANTDRAWPVILDPVVTGNSRYTNVKDVTVAETGTESSTRGVIQCGYLVGSGAMRMYMQYINLPVIPSGNVIVDATISLIKPMNYATASNVEVYKVTETWTSSTITWANKAAYEEEIVDYVVCQNAGTYTWNITSIVQDWYETGNYGMMFKTPSEVETGGVNNWKQFYSSDFSNSTDTLPALSITYQPVSYEITLSHDSAELYTGETLELTATTTPDGETVDWESDAPTVASVSDTGVVEALSPGTAVITATIADDVTAACYVVVSAKTISFEHYNDVTLQVYKGNTITLTPVTEPADEPVIWTSLNPDIATVSNGVVTGVSPGNAVIKASLSDDICAVCEVEVLATDVYFDCVCGSDCVEDCTCGCPDISIYIEDTVTLTAITVPSGQSVTWESDDPTIATVNQTGMVTGISTGTTKIRAYIDQYTFAECTVTINAWQINWDESSIRIAVGYTYIFEATTTPFGKQITWSSSDPTIAAVSQNGEVTGIKAGVATIKAKLNDGTYATCHVYVKKTGSLNYVQNGVVEGDGFVLTITTQGVSNMTWTSADTSIATVTNQGYVTGVKSGRVRIYVDSPDIIEPLYCVVDVYFKEGIYYIQNTDNSHFVTVQSNRIFDDSPIIQSVNNSERGELYQLAQLWKICYIGNGHYSIRAAHRLNMGLCVKENNDVVLMDIGSIDSADSVPDAAQWDISYVENAYMVSSIVAGVLMPNSNYTSIGTKIICGEGQLSDSCIWNIALTSVSPRILLYDAKTGKYLGDKRVGVIPDDVAALSDLGIIVSEVRNTGVNQGTSYWISSNPDVAKVDEYTGTVTGETYGVITINVVKNVEGTTCKNTYTLVVSEIRITGHELEYDSDSWNYTKVKYDDERENWLYIQHYTNCYAYALNNQIDPLGKKAFGCNIEEDYNYESPQTQQPGDIYDTYNTIGDLVELKDVNDSFDASKLKEAVELDFRIYNSKKGKCEYFGELADDIPIDGYKVYLAIRPKQIGIQSDYHWYRQNPDGTWSHKRGPTPVTNKDNNGNPIQNPKEAAVLAGYTLEVGYFIVTPWDNLYQPATTLQDVGSSMSSHIYVMHLSKIKYGDELNCSGNRVAVSDVTQNQKNVSSNLMYELYEKDCYNMRGYFHTSIGVFQIVDIRKKTIKEVNHNV